MDTVLFVCTHNSARSQMAEGLVNHYFTGLSAYSAGTEEAHVRPQAIEVMKELGIDISSHRSKTIDEFMDRSFDFVVTVCDNANETCPYFPNASNRVHKGFEDPSSYDGSEENKLAKFRESRDQIKNWIDKYFKDYQ